MADMHLKFSKDEIAQRVEELAKEIRSKYIQETAPIVMICILKGACIFFSDLIRRIQLPVEIDFIRVASYGDDMTPGENITFTKALETDIKNKHAIIVEDIVDTGLTIDELIQYLWGLSPLSLEVCTLIHKTERRMVQAQVDYWGFRLKEGFIVGYGLDYAEQYRQLEGIYEICQEPSGV